MIELSLIAVLLTAGFANAPALWEDIPSVRAWWKSGEESISYSANIDIKTLLIVSIILFLIVIF